MELMFPLCLCLTIVAILSIKFFLFRTASTIDKKIAIQPPSPPQLPVIGNLHQVGTHPHRSLRSLSLRHGPLMLLHLGSVPVLVVSSADAAREVMQTHDRVFASRPRTKLFQKLLYDGRDVGSAPYGEYWRQMKSVCVLHLLSNKMVRSFQKVREEEITLMMEKIHRLNSCSSSSPINLSELFTTLTNDVICRVALGRKYSGDEGDTINFREFLRKFTEVLGGFNVGDHIPWLAWIDKLRGFDYKVEKMRSEFDDFLEKVVQDHLYDRCDDKERFDFVDVLLSIQREKTVGFEIDRLSIKAIILDVFVGGTDTSYTLLEWAMSEILRHPECMNKLRQEIDSISRSYVSEDDVQNMSYLKAVIKETLRLHPPLPLLVPRQLTQDITLHGYHIAAGTQVFINAWAIGRDTATWGPDAEEFRPERFLESSVDFRGQDFKFIPFGAGRRICPAITFATAVDELALANILHRFNWKVAVGLAGEQSDIAESTGIAVHRQFPLFAFASSV